MERFCHKLLRTNAVNDDSYIVVFSPTRNFLRLMTPTNAGNLALAFYFLFGYYGPILNGGQSPATFLAGKLPGNQRRRLNDLTGSALGCTRTIQQSACVLENRLGLLHSLEDVW